MNATSILDGDLYFAEMRIDQKLLLATSLDASLEEYTPTVLNADNPVVSGQNIIYGFSGASLRRQSNAAIIFLTRGDNNSVKTSIVAVKINPHYTGDEPAVYFRDAAIEAGKFDPYILVPNPGNVLGLPSPDEDCFQIERSKIYLLPPRPENTPLDLMIATKDMKDARLIYESALTFTRRGFDAPANDPTGDLILERTDKVNADGALIVQFMSSMDNDLLYETTIVIVEVE